MKERRGSWESRRPGRTCTHSDSSSTAMSPQWGPFEGLQKFPHLSLLLIPVMCILAAPTSLVSLVGFFPAIDISNTLVRQCAEVRTHGPGAVRLNIPKTWLCKAVACNALYHGPFTRISCLGNPFHFQRGRKPDDNRKYFGDYILVLCFSSRGTGTFNMNSNTFVFWS